MSRIRNSLILASLAVTASCSNGPIAWEDSTAVGVAQPRTFVLLNPKSVPRMSAKPAFPGECPGSMQYAIDRDGAFYATWWSLRPDSTADLMASFSADGKSWSPPSRVDSSDVATVGCDRPRPSLTADLGNVYVVYSMKAREGPGIFLAHSMDKARTFHSPVAVVYGERPGLASVAAVDKFVIVAFEDPNSSPPRISVAVSNTMAHLFEFRSVMSPKDAAATHPDVNVIGDDVLLTWQRAGSDSSQRIELRGKVRGLGK